MGFFSFSFLIFLSALLLVFHQFAGKSSRRAILTIANATFLLSFGVAPSDLLALAAFAGGGFLMLRLVETWPSRTSLTLLIAAVAGGLVFVKQYWFLHLVVPHSLLAHRFEIIGVSYFSFKLIHMLVDRAQGTLSPYSLLSYLNYQLGFVSLVAGPIQRYNEFHGFWQTIDAPAAEDREGLLAWNRLLNGLIKLGLLATVAMWIFGRFEQQAQRGQLIGLLGMFYTYPAYVYWNFAGYCDVVIAAAALIGLKQPENFKRPYLARNLIDFWNRWHISLTLWIRDYVFMTSYKALAGRWPRRAKWTGYGLLFMALFLAGVWHGPGLNFAVFGLMHGAGVVVCQVYTDALRKKLGRAGVERYLSNPWVRMAAISLTLNYVCASFLFFRPETQKTLSVFLKLMPKVLE